MKPGQASLLESTLETDDGHDRQATLRLTGVLNFDSVTALARKTGTLFQDYDSVDIDMSGITYVNSAGLALLLNLKQQAEKDGKKLHITGTPEKLVNIARMSELESILFGTATAGQ